MTKLNCNRCGKSIIVEKDPYYEGNYGIIYCNSCGNKHLLNSQHGYYEEREAMGNSNAIFNNDLSDVDFFIFHKGE